MLSDSYVERLHKNHISTFPPNRKEDTLGKLLKKIHYEKVASFFYLKLNNSNFFTQ